MKPKISYEKYFDKVYGCFIGKTIAGTLGAPYEGVKMDMELTFDKSMIDVMLPNDDLDLQILWLDVVEQYGAEFTSYDLLKRFCEYCSYSPGEYAIMRKNFEKRINPPYSGIFCNSFYREGMGCPIRSEIWACLAPGNPKLATDFSMRDGQIDHDSESGESVIAEMYFASLESLAFFESDIKKLMIDALAYIPRECKFASLVQKVMMWCAESNDIKRVRRKILFEYGHPDCTNMYQNMGITLASLLLGRDLIDVAMKALNCGFDTDCTCASAGSVVGIIYGAKALLEQLGIDDVKYKLSVTSEGRTDSVRDLCVSIAESGATVSHDIIENAPVRRRFPCCNRLVVDFDYESSPTIQAGGKTKIKATVRNRTQASAVLTPSVIAPEHFTVTLPQNEITLPKGGEAQIEIVVELSKDAPVVWEKNVFSLGFGNGLSAEFGLSGIAEWNVFGPFWRTEPISNTALLEGKNGYWHLLGNSRYPGGDIDKVRHFHLNTEPDTIDEEKLLSEIPSPVNYEFERVYIPADDFQLSDFIGFSGAYTAYLSRKITAKEDMSICIQVGQSQPYKLWLNGEPIAESDKTAIWTSENQHVIDAKIKKGTNLLVLRVTVTNADTHMSIIFSREATCAEHITDFGSERNNENGK